MNGSTGNITPVALRGFQRGPTRSPGLLRSESSLRGPRQPRIGRGLRLQGCGKLDSENRSVGDLESRTPRDEASTRSLHLSGECAMRYGMPSQDADSLIPHADLTQNFKVPLSAKPK